jgi:hypothetical protein
MLENLCGYDDDSLETLAIRERKYRLNPHVQPSAIVAASFGTTSCNERLADAVNDARRLYNQDLFAVMQWEVFSAYLRKYSARDTKCVGGEQQGGAVFSQLDTRGVLSLAKEDLSSCGIALDNLLYVAHPAHMHRVMAVGRKLGMNGTPFVEQDIYWSEPHDRQKWTRGPKRWAMREVLTRAHHKIKGYT